MLPLSISDARGEIVSTIQKGDMGFRMPREIHLARSLRRSGKMRCHGVLSGHAPFAGGPVRPGVPRSNWGGRPSVRRESGRRPPLVARHPGASRPPKGAWDSLSRAAQPHPCGCGSLRPRGSSADRGKPHCLVVLARGRRARTRNIPGQPANRASSICSTSNGAGRPTALPLN